MRLGYVILYVPDVEEAVSFYEQAFGLKRRFVASDGNFGEVETGATALGFASNAQAQSLGLKYTHNLPGHDPAGIEIAFVVDDVPATLERAQHAGARMVVPPTTKPWGQMVAYVRDPNGVLVEICTEVKPS